MLWDFNMRNIFPKKLFNLLLFFWVFYNLINLSKNSILKYNGLGFKDKSWLSFLFDGFIIENLYSIALFMFIIYTAKKFLDIYESWFVRFAFHFLLSILTLVIIFFTYDFYTYYFKNLTGTRTLRYYILNIVDYSNVHFLIYFTNVFIVNTYYYLDKIKSTEVQKAKLKQQLSDVKVNILKYQLHPHFFFNTLNSISHLIEVDKTLAQNTLADFSDLLRDIVYLKDTNFLNLGKEIDILKRYLDIMSIRFSDHLEVNLNVQKDLEDVLIPSLIIQPIIENSFNHGYSDKNTSLKIEISIKKNKDYLEIKIKNNGAPLAKNNVIYGTGLKNTIERLETLYDDYKFSIKNIPNKKGVVTKLAFPIKYE